MADNPTNGAAQQGFNLTSGAGAAVNQGITSGAGWAASKANLDMQQQYLQEQKQQHDQRMQEYKAKVFTQQYDQYKKVLALAPGDLKKQASGDFETFWEQAGHPVHPTWLAAAKDKTYAPQIADVFNSLDGGIRIKDPEAFNKAIATANYFGSEFTPDKLSKLMAGSQLAVTQKARLDNQTTGIKLRTDTAIRNAANDIHNDSDILATKKRYESVIRGAHNISDDMNVSTAHEVLQDFAAALSGQNASSNFKIESISPKTLEEMLTKVATFAESDPNLPAPSGIVAFLKKQAPRLAGSFEGTIKAAAESKGQGKDYETEDVRNAAQAAVKEYSSGKYFERQKAQTFGGETPEWFSGKEKAKSKEEEAKTAAGVQKAAAAILKQPPGPTREALVKKAMAALASQPEKQKALLQALQGSKPTVIGAQ